MPNNSSFVPYIAGGHAATHADLRFRYGRTGMDAGVMYNVGIGPSAILGDSLTTSVVSSVGTCTALDALAVMATEAMHDIDAASLIRTSESLLPANGCLLNVAAARNDRSRSAKVGPSREDLLESAAQLKFFVIVLEEKGGVGKSVVCMAANETLKLTHPNVLLIDADVINQNLSRAGLTKKSDALNAQRIDFEGFLWDAAERLIENEVAGVVIDSAAGGEKFFRPQLRELAHRLRTAGSRLVVLRPLTTSPLVHDNIVDFATTTMNRDMGVLLIRNMGQGRTREDFHDFDTSPEYAEMRKLGMAECILESAGARYSDLVTGFGKSFADVALHEPEELGLSGRSLVIAKRVFTRPVRLFLARWLYRQTTALQAGLVESVLHTL